MFSLPFIYLRQPFPMFFVGYTRFKTLQYLPYIAKYRYMGPYILPNFSSINVYVYHLSSTAEFIQIAHHSVAKPCAYCYYEITPGQCIVCIAAAMHTCHS